MSIQEIQLRIQQIEAKVASRPPKGPFAEQLSKAQETQKAQPANSSYKDRLAQAQSIASRFDLKVTSGFRSVAHNAEVGGVPGSLHTKGLAFDMVGSNDQMQKAKAWAESRKDLFQEVLVHDVGSGSHLHLGFKAA